MKEINYLISIWSNFASQKGIKWNHSFLQWDIPNNIEADFALNLVLPIAHKNKLSIEEVAQEIINLTKQFTYLRGKFFPSGHINYQISSEYYYDFLNQLVISEGRVLQPELQNVRVNIEYVSANPTGDLHLGNLRSGVVGDTLANIYEFMGYQVSKEYYVNDRGGQIRNLVDSIYYFYHELQGVEFERTEIVYSGEVSKEIAQQLINKWEKKYLFKPLNSEDFLVWKEEILGIILTKIKKDLEKCGISYDKWFLESSLYQKNKHLELIKNLEEKKITYQQEGAIFLKTTLAGDEKDRVIVKKNNDYTYFFSDILYHLDKLSRADYLINFWGADHHGYIERLKSACQLLGYDQKRIEIILTQMVNLLTEDGQTKKFSKRSGNTININEALEWLGKDQLRFAMLEKEPNVHLTINKDLLQKEQEKSRLYYLQYAHARCCQLLNKAREKGLNWDEDNKIINNLNWNSQERKILKNLIRFPLILQLIIEENKPHYLIYYLIELAQEFQFYYQNNTIILERESEQTKQRILLTKGVKIVIEKGLTLLWLEAPMIM